MDDGQHAWTTADATEVEVFATGTTMVRVDDDHAVADQLRRGGEALIDGYHHVRDLQAAPGHRPGGLPIPLTSSRTGGDTDIVRPILVDPHKASDMAVSGQLFIDPIPHLEIDHVEHDPGEERYLVWNGRMWGRGRDGVAVSLHLLASTSLLVTVLELLPHRRLLWRRKRFIRDGVAALEELAHRFERA